MIHVFIKWLAWGLAGIFVVAIAAFALTMST